MTQRKPDLLLRRDHLQIVRRILSDHVPDRTVWVFGSRATYSAKKYSDLDLAILGKEPLGFDEVSALAECFSESDLPMKVDIVDWTRIDESFRRIIRKNAVEVQRPDSSGKSTTLNNDDRFSAPRHEIVDRSDGSL